MSIPLYYIRFLKPPPEHVESNQPFSVVWTIETDLGDAHYWQSVPVTCSIDTCQDPSVRLRIFSEKSKQKQVLTSFSSKITIQYDAMRGGAMSTRFMIESDSPCVSLQLVFQLEGPLTSHPVWLGAGIYQEDPLWIVPAWSRPILLQKPTKKTARVQIALLEPQSSQQAERILIASGERVRICEDAFQTIARHVWDCGLGMCEYLAAQAHKDGLHFKGKTLIELGSGTALVGLYAAKCLKPARVYLTDLPEAMEIMEKNAALVVCEADVIVKPLPWGLYVSDLDTWLDLPVDSVLLTDVLYNQGSHDILLDTLDWLVDKNTNIILAYKERNPDERVFFDKLEQRHYRTQQVQTGLCEIYRIHKSP